MTASERLLVDKREDGVVIATLNRPEANNAVSFEMWRAFAALLDDLDHDTPARALVITGAGRLFSTGGDMKIGPAAGEGALSPAARLEWGQRIIARLRRLPIPAIAAIEGGAFGMGWSIALACDVIIAADNASFSAPFVDFGLTPDGGAAWFLTQRIGRHRAADLMLTGRTMQAAEALQLGLISRTCASGAALETAVAYASALGKGNRHAVELTKRLLQGAETGDLDACHAQELAYCAILQKGDELARAKEAFAARSKNKT
ncbi:enoyl-CoA hydratase [alpha proteobacterium U9-1i]|nr:enoyl-CoA hydratase [alpha proteobacterium U9-1i]